LLFGLAGFVCVAQNDADRQKRIEDSAKARFQRNTHQVVLDGEGKIIPVLLLLRIQTEERRVRARHLDE